MLRNAPSVVSSTAKPSGALELSPTLVEWGVDAALWRDVRDKQSLLDLAAAGDEDKARERIGFVRRAVKSGGSGYRLKGSVPAGFDVEVVEPLLVRRIDAKKARDFDAADALQAELDALSAKHEIAQKLAGGAPPGPGQHDHAVAGVRRPGLCGYHWRRRPPAPARQATARQGLPQGRSHSCRRGGHSCWPKVRQPCRICCGLPVPYRVGPRDGYCLAPQGLHFATSAGALAAGGRVADVILQRRTVNGGHCATLVPVLVLAGVPAAPCLVWAKQGVPGRWRSHAGGADAFAEAAPNAVA